MKKKVCTKCGQSKSTKAFDKRFSNSPKLRSHCRKCDGLSWNPQRKNISNRIRSGRLHSKMYGWAAPIVSIDEVVDAVSKQNGLCVCCGLPFGEQGWHLDHCHVTGVFRGLLCRSCNLIEGIASSPEQCEAIAVYMRRFQCTQLVG